MAWAKRKQGAKGVYYQAGYRDASGVQRASGHYASKREAKRVADELEALARQGKGVQPGNAKVRLFDFVNDVWLGTLTVAAATRERYLLSLNNHILPTFGEVQMRNIRPADIEKWFADMLAGDTKTKQAQALSTATANVNLLATILKKAVQNGFLNSNPCEQVRRKKPSSKPKAQPLTRQQVESLLQEVPERFRVVVYIGVFTGMRPSEILGLTLDRVDFENGQIRIDRQLARSGTKLFAKLKTPASYRTISLTSDLRMHLLDHIARFGTGPEGLIVTNRSGRALRYGAARMAFSKAVQAVPLPQHVGLHALRHTFVSLAIQFGAHPKQIQVWVGHSSISETMDVYGHLFDDSLQGLAKKFDGLLAIADRAPLLQIAG